MVARLPAVSIRLRKPVEQIEQDRGGWRLTTANGSEKFDAVVLATPPHVTSLLLRQVNGQGSQMANLLPQQATSAIVVALAFAPEQAARLRVPRGFGFVVPQTVPNSEDYPLLACTFVDQKFPGRVPQGALLLRAFFGGHSGEALLKESDDRLIERARLQLGRVLGPLPQTTETVVRRWPLSLPQYSVGHLDRMAELESLLAATPTLRLVGSAYYGVGLPDLIRQGRSAARSLSVHPQQVAK
jgi:oxygen-dependent protoporphyrinogen oxidase